MKVDDGGGGVVEDNLGMYFFPELGHLTTLISFQETSNEIIHDSKVLSSKELSITLNSILESFGRTGQLGNLFAS